MNVALFTSEMVHKVLSKAFIDITGYFFFLSDM